MPTIKIITANLLAVIKTTISAEIKAIKNKRFQKFYYFELLVIHLMRDD